MRVLISLLLLGAVCAPALAQPYGYRYRGDRSCGYRSYRYRSCGPRYYHGYRGYGQRRHYRSYARGYYRPYHRRSVAYRYQYGYGQGCGYGYGHDGYYRYGRHLGRGCYVRSYIRLAPIYSRYGASLTLVDDVIERPAEPESDADGLPQPRSVRVGERFLVSVK